MAEFCKNCFLELHPDLKEKDLILIKDIELCEGCGKVVNATVYAVKQTSVHKIYKSRKNANANDIKSKKEKVSMAWRDEEYVPNTECGKYTPNKEDIYRLCDSGMFNHIIESYCRIVFDRLALTEKLRGFNFAELFDTISAEQAEILGAKLK